MDITATDVDRIVLPDGERGAWREMTWVNPVTRDLRWVAVDAEPNEAFRQLRVFRADGELLGNESWDQSRTRGVRIWPANRTVKAGEVLHLRAVAWWHAPVQLTAVLKWTVGEP
jgi:hypothetical protein